MTVYLSLIGIICVSAVYVGHIQAQASDVSVMRGKSDMQVQAGQQILFGVVKIGVQQ